MRSARVRVPATVANLGPGFDALGLALDLWLTVEAEPSEADRFDYEGEGAVGPADNLVHCAYRAAFAATGHEPEPVAVRVSNPIPLARGLGSSSAALVAGAVLADALGGLGLGREGVLAVCAGLEGHPDNVAPAVLGGFTASAMGEAGPVSVALPWPEEWRLLVAVPELELLTAHARAALPERYSRAEAIFNLSRAALWAAAVAARRPDALLEASRDRIHQPHRAPLVPGLADALAAATEAGALATFLAGAGPSVAAVVAEDEEPVLRALGSYAPRVLRLGAAGGYEMTGGLGPARPRG